MDSLRRGVTGRDVIVVVAIVAALLVLALTGAIGSAFEPRTLTRERFVSPRFGFAAHLPAGWNRSAKRLVPNLLIPTEIFSAGTFPMPVGGGGNCGREPVAAIDRMKPGDALVSIQEYGITSRTRPRLAQIFPSLSTYSSAEQLDLRREPRVRGARIAASQALWSATLPFGGHGRGFDALVYLKGTPSRARLEEIVSVLEGFDFKAGTYVQLPGATG